MARRRPDAPRPTIFDSLTADTNLFCRRADLGNEASVEQFFANRLIAHLGYKDAEIKPKESLDALPIPRGRKKEDYKPDYVLFGKGEPRIVVDAKATTENVDDWTLQCSGYAAGLNRRYTGEKPVRYYVITSGLVTKVFAWDEEKPCLPALAFEDIQEGNSRWAKFKETLSAKAARRGWRDAEQPKAPNEVHLGKPPLDRLTLLFKQCHDLVWNSNKSAPLSAWTGFVKLMFVKLSEDKRLHDDPVTGPLLAAGKPIPMDEVRFSKRWIESVEKAHPNPVDALLFQQLMSHLEEQVKKGHKKRIFPEGERLNLTPGVVKEIVARLEGFDLWGIDEDLNGRLFEHFLGATMRGQALGQYFTPRTIVKFTTKLAAPLAEPDHIERVIDASCGTGGFLIEVLTEMRQQLRANESLTDKRRAELQRAVAEESIFGMDAGTDPPLARIARINMYLHGDGGSRIYAIDSLDKVVSKDSALLPEEKHHCDELRSLLGETRFDLVLTNPPFSMTYKENMEDQKAILGQYDLRKFGIGTAASRKSLKSSVMFLERYHDLLEPGGRLVTVMDDSILNGATHGFARDWIRQHFIVKAVISLPGDAFQRSGARAKTSILYLVKKTASDERQASVFMAECEHLGLDDLPQRTRRSVRDEAERKAKEEGTQILENFAAFLIGKKGPWLVPAERIADRFDAKYCLPRADTANQLWETRGLTVKALLDVADEVGDPLPADQRPHLNDSVTFLKVTYDGLPGPGEQSLWRDITAKNLRRAKAGDIVVSHINAIQGAIGVVEEGMENLLISTEYTVIRVRDKTEIDPFYLWAILRSPETRAALLSPSTGGGRHRMRWDNLKDVRVPMPGRDGGKTFGNTLRRALAERRRADEEAKGAVSKLETDLALSNEGALKRIRSAKPPK